MSLIEKIILGTLFVLLLGCFTIAKRTNFIMGQGDNAIASEIVQNIANNGTPSSQLAASVLEFLFKSGLLNNKPEDFEKVSLKATKYQNISFFKFHFVPIYYLVAPFTKIFPINLVLAGSYAFSFLGMIFILYLFLRKQGISIIGSVLFCLLIASLPAWSMSFWGQLYPDRYFMFLGFVFALVLTDKKPRFIWFIIIAALCFMIVEKMIIICAAFMISYLVLYWKEIDKKFRKYIIITALIFVISAFIIIKYFLNNFYYSAFLTISSFINFPVYLTTVPALTNLIVFLFFNFILLLIFGAFEWQVIVISFIVMIPNIFGDIGGAEKTNWYTHYHSTYFPILVWALSTGFVKYYHKIKTPLGLKILYSGIFVVTIVILGIWPFSLRDMKFNFKYLDNNTLKQVFDLDIDYIKGNGNYAYYKNNAIMMQKIIPDNSIVSLPELPGSTMLSLCYNKKLYYYPLGIDDADYVVLSVGDLKRNPPLYLGASSYTSDIGKINEILSKRLKDTGYDVEHPSLIGGGFAIIKRIK